VPQVRSLQAAKAVADGHEAANAAAVEQATAAAVQQERESQSAELVATEQAAAALQERLNTQLLRNATAAKEAQTLRDTVDAERQKHQDTVAAHAVELAAAAARHATLEVEYSASTTETAELRNELALHAAERAAMNCAAATAPKMVSEREMDEIVAKLTALHHDTLRSHGVI